MSAYCPCSRCCEQWAGGRTKSGWTPHQGTTVAADPRVWPIGTCLEIAGLGKRWVQDVGGAIKGLKLDVFYYHHRDARLFGRREMRVKRCL